MAEVDPEALALAERVAEVAEQGASGTGDTGLVEVRVGADGRLLDVHLDPRAMRLPSADLAAEIKLAAERGYSEMNQRLRDGLRDVLGPQVAWARADTTDPGDPDSFGWVHAGGRW